MWVCVGADLNVCVFMVFLCVVFMYVCGCVYRCMCSALALHPRCSHIKVPTLPLQTGCSYEDSRRH